MEAWQGNIILSMKGQLLISIVHLCMAGCTTSIKHDQHTVKGNDKAVLKGMNCNKCHCGYYHCITIPTRFFHPNMLQNSMKSTTYSRKAIRCNGSNGYTKNFPPKVIPWCKAIDNDTFLTLLGHTFGAVKKCLPALTAIAKGHMAWNYINVKSTTKAPWTRTSKKWTVQEYEPQETAKCTLWTMFRSNNLQRKW